MYKIIKNGKSILAPGKYTINYEPLKRIEAPNNRYGIMVFQELEDAIDFLTLLPVNNKKKYEIWKCNVENPISLLNASPFDIESMERNNIILSDCEFPRGSFHCSAITLLEKITWTEKTQE